MPRYRLRSTNKPTPASAAGARSAGGGDAQRPSPPARDRIAQVKWIMIALLIALVASPVAAQRQRTPVVCTRIVSAGPVHNGQYAGINCEQGHYLAAAGRQWTVIK